MSGSIELQSVQPSPGTGAEPSQLATAPLFPIRPAAATTPPVSAVSSAAGTPRVNRWSRQYAAALAASDVGAVLVATALGYFLRFGLLGRTVHDVPYLLVGAAIVAVWMACLVGVAAYEIPHMTSGAEEFKRVIRGTLWTAGLVSVACYLLRVDVARGFVAGVLPLGLLFLVGTRFFIRRLVGKMRVDGLWSYQLVAVGTAESVLHLVAVTSKAQKCGLRVVGACVPDLAVGTELAPGVPVLGGLRDAAAAAERISADVLALTGTALGPTSVRELGWELEGTGRGLIMAPGLTEVAGPRVHVSPVEGLPLMWVEQPQFTGVSRVVKRALDLVGGLVVLLLALPVLAGTACLIKLTSTGPIFFKQSRLGIHGDDFMVYKFRSMYADAEARREALLHRNEQDGAGVLFKIAADPRITPVGKWIRRLSIDELPQIFNVLQGRMSLVGPRPLATIDSTYSGSARRRLLVRPGMTGLWQVSGRSNTSWEDAVRLDLYYVENWSLALDVTIIARTVWTVLKRQGAY